MKRFAWIAYLAAGAIGGLGYYFIPPLAKSGPFFNVLGFSSVGAILLSTRLHKPRPRLPWLLFAVGQALFIAGDVITYNYQRLFHVDIPFPSVGDAFYLAVYPCLIAGILVLIHRRNPSRDRDSLIDSLMIAVGLGLLSWTFLMAPYAHDHTLSAGAKVISMAYPLMDILLLAVAVRLAVGGGRREPAFYLLSLGVLALLLTDTAYGFVQLSGVIYQNGGPLEAGWLSFYLLWGAAALHPSMRTLAKPSEDRRERFPRGRLVVLAAASLMAPAVQAIQAVRGRQVDFPVVIGGSVALFMLAIARMSGLVVKHEQAEMRERTLREAGAAFVAATTREELYAAAVAATRGLVGDGPSVRLCLEAGSGIDPDHLTTDSVPASPGTEVRWLPLSVLPLPARTELIQTRAVEVEGQENDLRAALGWPGEAGPVLLTPLFVRDRLAGFLAVMAEEGQEGLPRPMRDALASLSSQVALALESAVLTEDLHRRQSEARFASLVKNSSDVVTVLQADSTIRYQSPSVKRVLGYEPEELMGTRLLALVHPEDVPRLTTLLAEVSGDRRPQPVEFRWQHHDGTWLHVESLWSDLSMDQNVGGIVLNTRDVSERKLFEEQLTHQAFHDAITGLANRALFRDRVEHALERQIRDDHSVAVLFLDIDDFKTINDSLGHAAGDELLTMVGDRLRGCLRAADTAARLGGDEFGVLLEETGYTRAAEVAQRVMDALESPMQVERKEVFVRASIGIAIGDSDRKGMKGAEELLRNADVAMYSAKNQGKNRYQMFQPEMHATVLKRLELKADLQRAVENQEFTVHYQPVVVLETGIISGVEALVRWNHPERGLVPPLEFIPLAEETGLIVPIGRWVLHEACRQAVALHQQFPSGPPLTMSVNLSARQLQHEGLVEEVRTALATTGMDPGSLVLEITETVMAQDSDMATLRLSELKGLGVLLAIDDFGTGYSSLNYIRQFPVDILKVDKSFIDGINEDGEESALTAAIIKLASTLQLRPVAEGIERVEQLDKLLELRCDLGQGYYFARPLDPDSLKAMLTENEMGKLSQQAMPTRPTR
jgi:diguanylate cyclase (GGDEF)-like protein/PAS domain S-box-containing protein